ncbi:cell division protein FtsA C-terminal domain-containing protein, partial [Burkholderia cenocepacia]|nr:cell division protein FtsA C-terminal domain-containing protein [Burkholderia cenocepacia]
KGENDLSHQPISFGGMLQKTAQFVQSTPVQPAPAPEVEPVAPTEPMADFQQASQNKPKLADRFRGLIGSMFDE